MAKRETYTFTNGWSMQREVGHPFYWLLRDHNDEIVERDKYRHDVIERHRLTVLEHQTGGLDD